MYLVRSPFYLIGGLPCKTLRNFKTAENTCKPTKPAERGCKRAEKPAMLQIKTSGFPLVSHGSTQPLFSPLSQSSYLVPFPISLLHTDGAVHGRNVIDLGPKRS